MIRQLHNAGFHFPIQISLTIRSTNAKAGLVFLKVISRALANNCCLHPNVSYAALSKKSWDIRKLIQTQLFHHPKWVGIIKKEENEHNLCK